MIRNALSELRHHPTRLGAVALAIMISVGFLTSSLVFVSTETNAIGRSAAAETSSSDVVIHPNDDAKGTQQAAVAKTPGVRVVEATYEGYTDFNSPAGAGAMVVKSMPSTPELRWATLASGQWPAAADQVVVSGQTAKQYGLVVGGPLTFLRYASDGSGRSTPITMRVTGITKQINSLLAGVGDTGFVDRSWFTSVKGEVYAPTLLVLAAPSVSPDELVTRLRTVLPADTTVETSAQVTAQTVKDMTNGADVFRYLLLVFAAIALLVGSLIIANTFSIVLAQRRRQIGLLRAVGASSSQVRRGVLVEALVVGVAGSLLGVGLSLGIAAIATAITGSLTQGLVVPVGQVVLAAVAGLVATVLSAVAPAARAMRIAPLEALRPVADATTAKKATRARVVVAGFLLLLGTAVTAYALTQATKPLILAIAGSFVLAVGILAAAPLFLPAVLRLAGRAFSWAGPSSRLAAANTVRNPARAAATCIALMLGVGLIVTLQVGAASVKSSTSDTLNAEFPVDLTVTNPVGPISPAVVSAVQGVDGIRAVLPVRLATVTVKGGSDTGPITVAGLTADAGRVVTGGLGDLSGSVALAHPNTLSNLSKKSGDTITLTSDGRTATFTLKASDVPDFNVLAVTDGALSTLAPDAPVGAVWASATDRSLSAAIMADVRKVTAQQPGLQIAGSLEQSASLNSLLDTLVLVATALLGVAVIIALIGVGNTLGLSVIERTRESALLRALGLQRRQLRLMLAVEAVLLGLVGAVVGIAAGLLFGFIGTAALVQEAKMQALRFSVSVPQTLAVVGIAVVAAALASILPARRAAQVAPASALAEA